MGARELRRDRQQKVVRVRDRLRLKNAVDGPDELDQVGDPLVALFRRELSIDLSPLELIEDGVLRLLFAVEEEYVFP